MVQGLQPGIIIAIKGAELLQRADLPPLVLFGAFVLLVALINLFITSGSAQWALMAPIVVPMFMYVGFSRKSPRCCSALVIPLQHHHPDEPVLRARPDFLAALLQESRHRHADVPSPAVFHRDVGWLVLVLRAVVGGRFAALPVPHGLPCPSIEVRQ